MTASDGSTADYYELPAGATQLQDLISHRNLNAQDGEMFRAIYRKGRASHSDELRDAKKVLFYAQAEVARLEKLQASSAISSIVKESLRGNRLPCNNPVRAFHSDPMPEPAVAMEDDSARMQAIGQNGEMAEEVYAAVDADPFAGAPDWAQWKAQDSQGDWYLFSDEPSKAELLWCREGGRFSFSGIGEPNPNWRDTLIQRKKH